MKVVTKFINGKVAFEAVKAVPLTLEKADDKLFAPIIGLHDRLESYALEAEKMFDELVKLGGAALVAEMLNIGQELSENLGYSQGQYIHGLKSSFGVWNGKVNLSMIAVHFADKVFQMAMDEGEDGKLDFEHHEFDEFIQSLRDELVKLNNM